MTLLIHSQTSTVHCWSLGMDKQFHPILHHGWNYLSMLGLNLNHVSKRGHRSQLLLWMMLFEQQKTNLKQLTVKKHLSVQWWPIPQFMITYRWVSARKTLRLFCTNPSIRNMLNMQQEDVIIQTSLVVALKKDLRTHPHGWRWAPPKKYTRNPTHYGCKRCKIRDTQTAI